MVVAKKWLQTLILPWRAAPFSQFGWSFTVQVELDPEK